MSSSKAGLVERLAFGGNDGDASAFADEVSNRIAVLVLVHNSVSARLEVPLKQGLGLVKVGDVCPG
jgi:hypothetical protein